MNTKIKFCVNKEDIDKIPITRDDKPIFKIKKEDPLIIPPKVIVKSNNDEEV